jgi:hypothetical protein
VPTFLRILQGMATCALSGAGGVASGSVTYTFSEANGTVDPASATSA